MKSLREGLGHYPHSIELGDRNLLKAWRAGVMLVTGSDAGNFLVLHGPTVQHEIELWVAAGIPPEVALQAATFNAAKLLRADDRIGTIEKGKEATLLDRGRQSAAGCPGAFLDLVRFPERRARRAHAPCSSRTSRLPRAPRNRRPARRGARRRAPGPLPLPKP